MKSGGGSKASRAAIWVILVLLIVGLAGFSVTNFGGNISSVGTVGNTPIEVNRYARELQREINAFSAQTGQPMTLSQAQQFGIDRAVIQRLVSTVALENEADAIGLSVGDARIRDQVLAIPGFQGLDGTFDREAYRFALDQAGLNEGQFEDSLRAEMARTMLQGAVMGGVPAPATFVQTIFTYVAERRGFSWTSFGTDALANPLADPTDADLRAYYDANNDAFMLPETRQITYAWLTPDMIVDTIDVDEDALRQAYEDRIGQFVTAERRLVERLVYGTADQAAAARVELDAGKDFEALVAERDLSLSDIDLGDVTEDDLGAAGPAVFALTEPGVVGPVDTELGPALIRMNGILAAQETTFDQARPELLDEFTLDTARRDIADRIEPVDDLLAGGATLEELADETDLRLGTIDWTAEASDGIAGYEAFRAAAAQAQVGDFPEVAELDDGGIFALRVDQVIAPRLQDYEDAKPGVETGWRTAETTKALTAQAQAVADQLTAGVSAGDLGVDLMPETDITRESFVPGTPPDFLDQVFQMQPGDIRVIEGDASAILVRLDAIAPPDTENADNVQRRDDFADATGQAIGADMLQAFTAAIQADAGISLDQAAINAVHANFP